MVPEQITVLFDRETIAVRVTEMGREISDFYRGQPLTVVVLMTGGMIFAADLVRAMDIPVWIDSIAVASYHGHASSGELKFRSDLKLDVKDRHVLLVDEVFDTGLTLNAVRRRMSSAGALSVKAAVAVVKEVSRSPECIMPEFSGFTAPDRYLIGYGLDSNEDGRQIPFIGAV
jgi:hypoxanthine phosphoribosyltransferase